MKGRIFFFTMFIFVSKATRHYLVEILGEEQCANFIINFVEKNSDINLCEFLSLTPKGTIRNLLELEYRRRKLSLDPHCILPDFGGRQISFLLFVINKMRKRLLHETSIENYEPSIEQILYFDKYIQFCYTLAIFHINSSSGNVNLIFKTAVVSYLKRALNLNRLAIIMTLEKYSNQFQSIVLVYKSDGALLPDHSLVVPTFDKLIRDGVMPPLLEAPIKSRMKLVLFVHKAINALILYLIKTCFSLNRIEIEEEEAEKWAYEERIASLAALIDSEIDKFCTCVNNSVLLRYSHSFEDGEFVILVGSDIISIDQIHFFTIFFPIDAPPVSCSLKDRPKEICGKERNKYIISVYLNRPNDYQKIIERLISNNIVLKYRDELEGFIGENS